jgi:ribosomal protein S8
MEQNIEISNFIAFAMAEIYTKYSNAINKDDEELKTLTDGIKLVIAKILDDEDIIKGLKVDKEKEDSKIINKLKLKPESKEVFFDLLSNFIE